MPPYLHVVVHTFNIVCMKTNPFVYVLILLCFAAEGIAAQDDWNILPDALRRPQRGEALRYPHDTVIGDLGRGAVEDGAYHTAARFLTALMEKDRESSVLATLDSSLLDEFLDALEPLAARKFRLGGGREEEDGSVSFLIRLLGSEQWISGELYLRFEHETWLVDELILEQAKTFSVDNVGYTSPYERIF
jgi:hypothetical protein